MNNTLYDNWQQIDAVELIVVSINASKSRDKKNAEGRIAKLRQVTLTGHS